MKLENLREISYLKSKGIEVDIKTSDSSEEINKKIKKAMEQYNNPIEEQSIINENNKNLVGTAIMNDESILPCKKCGRKELWYVENKLIQSCTVMCRARECNNQAEIQHHYSLKYMPEWNDVIKLWNENNE